MLAVIKAGGKQYLVKEGTKIKIEKVEGKDGDKFSFSEVLFAGDENKLEIGSPIVKEIEVEGKILKQGMGKKVTGIKHKPKKRYKVKFGHRQPFTEIEIVKIG
jgi:large subunit ribosomal protein L21